MSGNHTNKERRRKEREIYQRGKRRISAHYLAISEEEADALHADLQEAALIGDHVLDGKLAPELDVRVRTAASGRGLLHRIFYTVIEIFALQSNSTLVSFSFSFLHSSWQFVAQLVLSFIFSKSTPRRTAKIF